MEDEKNLLEFLEILIKLTQKNIDFIEGKNTFAPLPLSKYENELKQVQDFINSFDFV